MERCLTEKYPQNKFIARFYGFKPPFSKGTVKLNPMRVCLRTTYVVIITGVAMVFPYFNEVLGVLGALGFWPLAVYFPVEMCILQKKIQVWTRPWLLLRAFSFICLLVSLLAFVGSVYGLVGAKFRWSTNLYFEIIYKRLKITLYQVMDSVYLLYFFFVLQKIVYLLFIGMF